jgi:hypothetical protein
MAARAGAALQACGPRDQVSRASLQAALGGQRQFELNYLWLHRTALAAGEVCWNLACALSPAIERGGSARPTPAELGVSE